jgi:hypothetical protein
MNDASHLYLAVDNPNDITSDTSDSMGIYFDDNPLPSDGLWTNTVCSSPAGEGNFWAFNGTSVYREWIQGPAVCPLVAPAPGVNSVISRLSGHLQVEVAIDLDISALLGDPGHAIRMLLWILDATGQVFHGQWPLLAFYQDPATYGWMTLAEFFVHFPLLAR